MFIRLHYFGARYYDSKLSVWLSVDPLASGFPGVSAYVYCYNSPMNFIDEWGLFGTRKEARRWKRESGVKGPIRRDRVHDRFVVIDRTTKSLYSHGTLTADYKDYDNSKGGYLYYLAEGGGHGHSMIWNPSTNKVYEVHTPPDDRERDISKREYIQRTINNETKAIGYGYNMDTKEDREINFYETSDRENDGEFDIRYAKVWVEDVDAATSFFKDKKGQKWNYNLLFNNCKHYTIKGIRHGGGKVFPTGPIPVIWQSKLKSFDKNWFDTEN